MALTEDNPTIKAYNEAAWADARRHEADAARGVTDLLEAVHRRWVVLLESLKDEDLARPLMHPENGPMTLDRLLQLYAWHGRHHVAHITELRAARAVLTGARLAPGAAQRRLARRVRQVPGERQLPRGTAERLHQADGPDDQPDCRAANAGEPVERFEEGRRDEQAEERADQQRDRERPPGRRDR